MPTRSRRRRWRWRRRRCGRIISQENFVSNSATNRMQSSKPRSLEYAGRDSEKIADRGWDVVALIVTWLILSGLSFFVWAYQFEEPFYGGGDASAKAVYLAITPVVILGWGVLCVV